MIVKQFFCDQRYRVLRIENRADAVPHGNYKMSIVQHSFPHEADDGVRDWPPATQRS